MHRDVFQSLTRIEIALKTLLHSWYSSLQYLVLRYLSFNPTPKCHVAPVPKTQSAMSWKLNALHKNGMDEGVISVQYYF